MFLKVAAQGQNKWWTYLITLLMVVGAATLAQLPLAMLVMYKSSELGLDPAETQELLQSMDFTSVGVNQNLMLVLMLIPFAVGLLALWMCVKGIHRRDPKTLINPTGQINWRKVLFGFGWWLACTTAVELVLYLAEPENYVLQFQPGPFVGLLVISLLLFPMQTSFEEILFRGYLMQGIGLLSRNPWVPLLSTSVGFGLLHFMNPEVKAFGLVWAMSYYVGVGFFLGLITLLDDGLELALGIHAATNIYSALFVTFDNSALQTAAVFRVKEFHIEWTLVGLVAAAAVFSLIAAKKYKWKGWIPQNTASDENDLQGTASNEFEGVR